MDDADVLRAVRADVLVERFENGLAHVLEESGRTLSAGEHQLLGFARGLVANPPILIPAEATTSVDTETELTIQRAMAELTAGRTSIVIAHRLSTIRDADQIPALEHGEIIERGTHDELLTRGAYTPSATWARNTTSLRGGPLRVHCKPRCHVSTIRF